MKLCALWVLFGFWWVVTWSGRPVAGPYREVGTCNAVAQSLAAADPNVSGICQYY